MARVIMVKRADESVVFLGSHNSDTMPYVCLEMLRGTKRETGRRNDRANDEQDE